MTDIVERLRNKSPYLHGSSAERVMAEAADEIERLNARIAELEQRPTDGEIRDALRAAQAMTQHVRSHDV